MIFGRCCAKSDAIAVGLNDGKLFRSRAYVRRAVWEDTMEIKLSRRAAIVTGGSKGIGFAIAARFAASGADVAIVARAPDALKEAVAAIRKSTQTRIIGVQADVSKAADVQRAYDEVMGAFDKVDIVVNNAGTSQAMPFDKLTDEILYADLELKLFAAVRLIRLVTPQMKERRWGRIINVLNIGAKAPRPNSMPTSISRGAGMAMTKALSHELAPHNVLVNAMLVGLIRADQHVQRARRTNVTIEDYYDTLNGEIPVGRVGEAEEFANLACFLVSEQGGYITGTAINVDGGRSPVV
jgi:3-oxoacyl-[acyl-carrier protein] reductase